MQLIKALLITASSAAGTAGAVWLGLTLGIPAGPGLAVFAGITGILTLMAAVATLSD